MEKDELIVENLGRADAAELQMLLKQKCSVRESATLAADKQGDMSSVDLIIRFGPTLIGVLGMWLMKPRKGRRFSRTLRVMDKDGRIREETIHFDDFSSDSPKDGIVNALSKLFGASKEDVQTKIEETHKE
jgi:hypothetical protein